MNNVFLKEWMTEQIERVPSTEIYDESRGADLKSGKISRSYIQLKNIQIAAAAVLSTERNIKMPDMDSFYFPGRFEEIEKGVIIDVAHNPPAIKTLAEHIALSGEKVIIIYGAMKDKDIGGCLNILGKVARNIFPVSLDFMNRGADVEEIVSRSDKTVRFLLEYGNNDEETMKKAYVYSKDSNTTLLITGSFYTIEKFVQWRRDADGD